MISPILRLKQFFNRALAALGSWVAAKGATDQRFARLYYAIFSSDFAREQQAVLSGAQRYWQDVQNPGESAVLLRRNIHRLEKGLLMRPRRSPFALEYIEETINCYEAVASRCSGNLTPPSDELRWAHDVLTDYFEAQSSHPKLDKLKIRFAALPKLTASERKFVPYKRDLSGQPPVGYQSLLSLAQRRRSVRWFIPGNVPRELIDKALAVATLSPSACNRQPFYFRIVDDPLMLQEVIKIPMGLAGYGHNVPVLAVLIGQERCFFSERDRHLIYIDGCLAAMSFVFALESLGIGSCCVNWPDIEEKETRLAKVLRLDRDERPIMLIALGFPDPEGSVAYSMKKPVSQIGRYNKE